MEEDYNDIKALCELFEAILLNISTDEIEKCAANVRNRDRRHFQTKAIKWLWNGPPLEMYFPPVHQCASRDNSEVIKLLVEKYGFRVDSTWDNEGSDWDRVTVKNATPVHVAISGQREKAFEVRNKGG